MADRTPRNPSARPKLRRAAEAAEAAAYVDPSDLPAEPERSYSGAQLDPVDGWPVFANGMSRRRWLEETADERHAELVAALRADAEGAG